MAIYKKMVCDCCGKEFFTQYWCGGYIDHFENFASWHNKYIKNNNIQEMAHDIIFSGNTIRGTNYIKEFLECFKTWNHTSEDFKKRVVQVVEAFLGELQEAEGRVRVIETQESPVVLALLREENIDDAYDDLFYKFLEVDEND